MGKLSRFLVLLGLLAGAGYVAVVVWDYAASATAVIRGLSPEVQGPLVVAAVTILGSVVTITVGRRLDNRATVLTELRSKKAEIYDYLIKGLFRISFGKAMQNEMSPVDQQRYFVGVVENLTIWGSAGVIRKFGTFKQGGEGKNILFVIEELLLEIRKDLGHSNFSLGKGAILKMYINDFSLDEIEKLAQTTEPPDDGASPTK